MMIGKASEKPISRKGLTALVCGLLMIAPAVLEASNASFALPEVLTNPQVQRDHPLPDFSYAGYEFGTGEIPSGGIVVNVEEFGAIADDGKDDSAALKAALAKANTLEGKVRLQLGAGRYILSEILWLERSNIVIAGMGMGDGGTQLYMPRPLNQIDDGGALKEIREYLIEEDKYERRKNSNLDVLFSEYSWSGGFIWSRVPGGRHATYLERYDREIEKVTQISAGRQFSRELNVKDATNLEVGQVLQIHWHNRSGPEGALVRSLYGDTDERIGSRHWEMPDRPLVRQATRIERIEGNRVTIADPLLHDIDAQLPAYFARWDYISDVGIEDLHLVFPENPYFGHHNEAGYNGIYFTGVHNGWIRNVAISNSDSGILTDDLANVTIRNIVTDGDHKAHYSVHIGNVHNVLVDGLTVRNPTQHSLSFNTQATKSVYANSEVWTTPTLDQHAGANHQNLYDTVTVHVTPDRVAGDGTPQYDLYRAGGAGYWLPGHGRYNTTWNLEVLVTGGVAPGGTIEILAGSEGPEARIVGMHGNRPIRLNHKPTPYLEMLNQPVIAAPSLYSHQLQRRRGAIRQQPARH